MNNKHEDVELYSHNYEASGDVRANIGTGRVYFDKVTGVIGFVLNTMVLEIFAMRTIRELRSVLRVESGCVYLQVDEDTDGEEYDLVWFGGLLGFTEKEIRRSMTGVNFYVEGGV
jgi:hypothetical protein